MFYTLMELADKKNKLKKELKKISNEIDVINEEALKYKGISENQDLFIACLVNDLHFEEEKNDE